MQCIYSRETLFFDDFFFQFLSTFLCAVLLLSLKIAQSFELVCAPRHIGSKAFICRLCLNYE